MSNYSKQLESLYKMFDLLNVKYFSGKLESVTITIQENKKNYGHITTNKVWVDNENIETYEINISATHLQRSKYELVATLLHEMVHLFCFENNIQDTSRQGRYHNKEFKKQAELRDLKIYLTDGIGYSVTAPTENLIKFIDNSEIEFYEVYRICAEKIPKPPKSKEPIYKYVCSCCGLEIKTSSENANIICGTCNQVLAIEK